MDLKQLETFICLCKRKSFSKAAKDLYVSQPTVTNHIRALEEELSVSLINRGCKSIMLTQAGELLLDFAQKVLMDRTTLDHTLLHITGTFTGSSLSIVTSTVPELYLVPNIIKDFLEQYPFAKFKINHLDSLQVMNEIENKNYVFGFTGYKKSNSALKFKKIAEDEMVIIEGKNAGFIDKKDDFICFDDIIHLPYIAREEGSGSKSFFKDMISEAQFSKLNVIAEVETFQLIKQLVLLNIGISFISKNSLTKEEIEKLNLYKIKDATLNRSLYFVYNPHQYLSVLEETFKNMVLSMCWAKKEIKGEFTSFSCKKQKNN